MPIPSTRPALAVAVLLALVPALAAPASAKSGREILEKAIAAYEGRLDGVAAFTVVQEVMGREISQRFVKKMVDGRPVIEMHDEADVFEGGAMYAHLREVTEGATLEGSEKVDGASCWIIGLPGLAEMAMKHGHDDDFVPEKGTVYIDQKQLVMRRMVMEGTATTESGKKPVTMEMTMRDYREVDGLLHPFVTEVRMEGLEEEMPDMAEMQEGLAEMKKQLAALPEDQRRMAEQMMKGQMEQLEKMTQSGDMTMTMSVKELRVEKES